MHTNQSTHRLAVFDLDDTLNRLASGVFTAMARKGFRVPVTSRRHYRWRDVFGAAAPDMATVMIAERLFESAAANPSTVSAARTLMDAGWRVEVWTARAWHPEDGRVTREWLDRNHLAGVPFRLTGIGQSKAELIPAAGLPDFYVDDNPVHAAAMRAAGCMQTFVYARPWNAGAIGRLNDTGLVRAVRGALA